MSHLLFHFPISAEIFLAFTLTFHHDLITNLDKEQLIPLESLTQSIRLTPAFLAK